MEQSSLSNWTGPSVILLNNYYWLELSGEGIPSLHEKQSLDLYTHKNIHMPGKISPCSSPYQVSLKHLAEEWGGKVIGQANSCDKHRQHIRGFTIRIVHLLKFHSSCSKSFEVQLQVSWTKNLTSVLGASNISCVAPARTSPLKIWHILGSRKKRDGSKSKSANIYSSCYKLGRKEPIIYIYLLQN